MTGQRILVTGASGYLGRQVVARLAEAALTGHPACVVAHDIRTSSERLPGVVYEEADIRDVRMDDIIARHGIDTVVHLASIVAAGQEEGTVGPGDPEDLALLFWTTVKGLALHRVALGEAFRLPDPSALVRIFALRGGDDA